MLKINAATMPANQLSFGSLVWAKMGGYPFWPGKVKDPAQYPSVPNSRNLANAGLVKFYGSNDHAWVKWDNMYDFQEHEKRFATKQNKKKIKFQKAIEKCNEALKRKMQNLPDSDDEHYVEVAAEEEENDPVEEKPKLTKFRAKVKSADGPTAKRRRVSKEIWTEANNRATSRARSPQSVMRVSRCDQKVPSRSEIGAKASTSTQQNSSEDALTGILAMVGDKTNESQLPNLPDSGSELGGYVKQKIIPTEKKIGFIGDGIMAVPLAMCLISSGHKVTVWNRRIEIVMKLVDFGATSGRTANEVVTECDIIISCFSEATDAKAMYGSGVNSIMTSMCEGKGIIEMTTMSTASIIENSKITKSKGGQFLEAPFGGSRKDAEEGKVVILAGGDQCLYLQAHSCFEAMGSKTFFLGELGFATSTRLIMDMISGTFMASLGEALSLAEKAGLDQYTLLEVLNRSDIACPLMQQKGQAVLEGHFPANYPIRQQQASMRLALQMGDDLDQPLHVAGAANELYKRTKAMGYGDRDMACIYRAVNT